MASRDGARARGTDGSDFSHRETVASHYQASVKSKRKLKLFMVSHVIITFYYIAKLAPTVAKPFGFDVYSVPEPDIWEWVYVFSCIFIFSLVIALKKNNITAMKTYAAGIFVTSVIPLLYAIICLLLSDDLKTFIVDGSASDKIEKFNGVPIVAVKSTVVAGSFYMHVYSVMCAKNLITAWTPKRGKRA